MLSLNIDGKITNIKGLNIAYLVNSTVYLCTSQDLLWDPKKDLVWLCRAYGKEIQSIREQLNGRQVKENFLGTAFFSALPVEEQRRCYHVLLGKEPPPSMCLTPAPPHGQPSPSTARPPILSQKSAPSLKDHVQQQSNLLRPPMPGKSKTTPGASPSEVVTKASPSAISSPRENRVSSEPTRDSRSRYRNSSAPTAPNTSRDISPEATVARPTKNIKEFTSNHLQKHNMIYQAQSVNMQNLALSVKPQVVRTKKSMESQAQTKAVPVFAHKPTTTTSIPQAHAHPTPIAATKPSEPEPRPHGAVSKAHSHNSAFPSANSAQPQVVAHTHPAHKIMAQRNSIIPKSHNIISAAPTVSDLESRKPESPSQGLAVVPPGGLYSTPPKPTIQSKKIQPAAPIMQSKTQRGSNGFVFELDAASPQVETFAQGARSTGFVAELPADNNPPPPPAIQRFNALPETPISPPQGPAHTVSVSAYNISPISPPTTFTALASMVQPINPAKTVPISQAPKLAPSPPALDLLPPSLMIGFRVPRLASNTDPRTRASSQSSNGSNLTATSNQYHFYHSPPNSRETSPHHVSTSAPNSRNPSPSRGPVYKAYTPPLTPPMLPKTESAPVQQLPPKGQSQAFTTPALGPAAVSAPQQGTAVPMNRASEFVGRGSPPTTLRAGVNAPQPLNFKKVDHLPNPLTSNPPTPQHASHVKHDSHQHFHDISVHAHSAGFPQQQPPKAQAYAPPSQSTAPQYIAFSAQHAAPPEPRRKSSLHQRNESTESNTSASSHDSEKLAQEYQLGLPSYGDGFVAQQQNNDAEVELKKSYRPSYAGNGYGAQYKLGSPDFGNKQGRFIDEFHFS
jgi:hypothetical protein